MAQVCANVLVCLCCGPAGEAHGPCPPPSFPEADSQLAQPATSSSFPAHTLPADTLWGRLRELEQWLARGDPRRSPSTRGGPNEAALGNQQEGPAVRAARLHPGRSPEVSQHFYSTHGGCGCGGSGGSWAAAAAAVTRHREESEEPPSGPAASATWATLASRSLPIPSLACACCPCSGRSADPRPPATERALPQLQAKGRGGQ